MKIRWIGHLCKDKANLQELIRQLFKNRANLLELRRYIYENAFNINLKCYKKLKIKKIKKR